MAQLFAVVAYLSFVSVFAYAIAFVSGVGVPRTVDLGPAAPAWLAVTIDVALVAFFGAAHSVMARGWFKRKWTRVVPARAERSAYVLIASAHLTLLFVAWHPIPAPALWRLDGRAALAVQAIAFTGWGVAGVTTFLLDHLELFGLRQAFARGVAHAPTLRTPLFYRFVRHPLYFGMLVGFWVTPTMTPGHLLLAMLMTSYVLVGVRHEERDLVAVFGDDYRRYQEQVPMLIPLVGARRSATARAPAAR